MKKIICMILTVLILLPVFSSCKNSSGTNHKETTGEVPEQTISVPDDLNRYMGYFVKYFYFAPFDHGVYQVDILTLVFQVCCFNKEDFDFVTYDESTYTYYIEGEGLREMAKILLGESFDVLKYQEFHKGKYGNAEYKESKDIYVVSAATDYWGGSYYNLKFSERKNMKMKETENGVIVTAIIDNYNEIDGITGDDVQEFTFDYHFEKVEYNGKIYYRILEVRLHKES